MTERIQAGPQPTEQHTYVEKIRRDFIDTQPEEIILKVEGDMFEAGRSLAQRSGKTTPDKHAMTSLRDLADATAGRYGAVPFSPGTDPSDQLEAETEANRVAREENLAQSADHAHANAADTQFERAALGEAPDEPAPPLVAGVLATVGIAVTATPTFLDAFVSKVVSNGMQGLMVSFAFAAAVAAALTWLLLRDATNPVQGSRVSALLAVLAAVTLPVGMAVLRSHDPVTAIGFGLVELAIVLSLEYVRSRLGAIAADVAEKRALVAAADGRVAVAQMRAAQAEGALANLRAERARHADRVRLRSHLARAVPALQAAARSAAEAGYIAGLAATQGQVFGSSVKLPGVLDAQASVVGPNHGRKE